MSRHSWNRGRDDAPGSGDGSDDADSDGLPEVDLTGGLGGTAAANSIIDSLALPAGSAMHAVLTMKRLPRNIQAKADMARFVISKLLERDASTVTAGATEQVKFYVVDPKKAAEVLQKRMANGGK